MSPVAVVGVVLIALGVAGSVASASNASGGSSTSDAPDASLAAAASDYGLGALLRHLTERWGLFAIACAIVLVAFGVNRYAPKKRRRIRRVVILFALYLLAFIGSHAFGALGFASASETLVFVTRLLAAFTVVNVVAVGAFDLLLPVFRVQPEGITTDVLVGMAYVVTTVLVLKASGVNTGSVLTTGAVVSGFVALSLQNTLSNIFGGLALQLDDSIHVGDWIQLENGKQGKVKAIRWRHTEVETRDWDTIVVPNSALLGGNITILGKRDGAPLQHRMWVYFNVDFHHSPAHVIRVVNEALQAAPIERVALEPKPHAICYDFAKDGRDSFAYYAARYWLTDLAVDDPTSSVVRARIYHALRRAGIPLARPTSTTYLRTEDEEGKRRKHHQQRIEALRSIELFRTLTDAEVKELADRLRYAPFTAGETMTKQGAVAHWLYIVTSGTADVRAHVEGATKTVATLQSPAFFGEMGLMTGEPRAADVVATSEVECYRLDKPSFESILKARPEAAQGLSEILAQRRAGLDAAREGLDAEAKKAREEKLRAQILLKIEDFFGLRATSIPPRPP